MLSSIGAYILGAGVALFIFDFFRHRWTGPPAGRNPWGASTLEWLYPPSPPAYNFRVIPKIHSRDPLWDQPELTQGDPAEIEGALRNCPDHRRETIGSDPVTGEPVQILRLPHPTWTPLIFATGLSLVFVLTLAKQYMLIPVGATIALIGLTFWLWEPSDSGVTRKTGLPGVRLPVNTVDRRSHLHVATVGSLLISFALYASILFSGLYLWNTQPQSAVLGAAPDAPFAIAALAGAGILALLARAASHLAARTRFGWAGLLDLACVLAALGTAGALGLALLPVDPWANAFGAVGWALAVFVATHLAVVVYWGLFNTMRKLARVVRPGQTLPDMLLSSYANGTAIMVAGAAAILLLVGRVT